MRMISCIINFSYSYVIKYHKSSYNVGKNPQKILSMEWYHEALASIDFLKSNKFIFKNCSHVKSIKCFTSGEEWTQISMNYVWDNFLRESPMIYDIASHRKLSQSEKDIQIRMASRQLQLDSLGSLHKR